MSFDKLDPDLQMLWTQAANSAQSEGYDEAAAGAIAWSVVNKTRGEGGWQPAIYMKYPLLRPGNYELAVGGTLAVTADTVKAVHNAIRRLWELGQPVSIVYGHGATDSIGLIPASMVEGDVLYGCLLYDQYYHSGVLTGAYGFSVEAYRNYSSEAYTEGKEYELWPVAWAMLGADEQPACPPGEPLAANESKPEPVIWFTGKETAPVRGAEPHGKEADEMDELRQELEALKVQAQEQADRIATLVAAEKELADKLQAAEQERDELRAAEEARQTEVRAAELQARVEKVLASEIRPGARDRIKAKLEAAETAEARQRLVEAYEEVVETVEVPGQTLHAAENRPADDETDPVEKNIEAAKVMAAEQKIPFNVALARVTEKKE